MKKFLALMSWVVPFSAAVAEPIVIDPATAPNSNVMDGLAVPSDNFVRVRSGNGLSLGTGGLSASNLYVGQAGSGVASGQIFVEPTALNPYTIASDGNVSITSVLEVLSGYSLGIKSKTQGATISSVNIGTISADGGLVMENIGTLNTGNITSKDNLEITANAANITGTIDSVSGNTTINVTNGLTITNDFIANGNAETQITAGSISARNIQNNTGSMLVESGGKITTSGSVENSGTLMRITGTDMTVDGTMKNDNTGSIMNKYCTHCMPVALVIIIPVTAHKITAAASIIYGLRSILSILSQV